MKTRRAVSILLCASLVPALRAQPQRIVSTAPSLTELLYALGLGDRVAGVTRFCRYPPEAMKKPKIGDFINPNLEAIAALKPDLVLIQTNPVRLAERLQRLHLRVLEVDQQNIAAICNSTREVGAATGATTRATQLIESIRSGLDAVRAQTAAFPRQRVMFVVGRTPGRLDGLIVAGKASYLNEVIDIAGGENVFRDAAAAYPEVSLEEVIARNAAVIVDIGDMGDDSIVSPEHQREVVALWQRVPSVEAVKQHRIFAIAPDQFLVPGPRVVDATRAMFKMLHTEPK
jgi:iron complex transport system substrate-binding protein